MKSLSDAQYAFKAAVRRAVKIAGGPSAAADVVRAHSSQLSRYGNPDAPEFAPIDICFELDKAADDHVVLRAWADLCGFELTPRNVDARVANDLTAAAGCVARESGEVISSAIEAAADGKLSPNEARQIDGFAANLETRVVQLRSIARSAMKTA